MAVAVNLSTKFLFYLKTVLPSKGARSSLFNLLKTMNEDRIYKAFW